MDPKSKRHDPRGMVTYTVDQLIADVREVVNYNWPSEHADYEEQIREGNIGCGDHVHVFTRLRRLDAFVGEHTLDANDESRDEQSALEHVVRLATSALGAVRDHVGEESWEDNTPSRALGRTLDAWDEFVQAIEPEKEG